MIGINHCGAALSCVSQMSPNNINRAVVSVGFNHLWLIEDPALIVLEMLRYNTIHVSKMF